MASPVNQNQPGEAGGGQFDMHKLFKPSPSPSTPLSSTTTPPQNPNYPLTSSPFPLPSASYPPPTGVPAATYSYSPHPPHPQHLPPNFHHHPQHMHNQFPPGAPPPSQPDTNLHPQRSVSFPTPPLQPTSPHHQFHNVQNPNNPNAGARLMALLSAPPSTLEMSQQPVLSMGQIQPTISGGSDFSMPNPGLPNSGPTRMLTTTTPPPPKGRHLIGDHVSYDIDVRLPGEVPTELEVTPITKYGSDPGLVLGRQIAVNKTYICYGLKLGAIRVLNINTALRALLKGLAQRVTDMAFFAEDVHLLASSSVDGRVYVWKLTEDPDEEEDKPQITGNVIIAIKITGEGQASVHPRVCWHCHKQEVLVVGIGNRVLKIDTTKVGKGKDYSAEEPLLCPVEKLIDGVHLVGEHDGEVTDLSMCQWMTTRLVSASVDGTIKIWEDRMVPPIAILRPHEGKPVSSVTFLAAPNQPDHIILITGGPLNRELKIWASESEEGWLLPIDSESWKCTQTFKLKSSKESKPEDAFFNQIIALSQAGLLLLANAKKNSIYAIHLDYNTCPALTHMDYISEFTVGLPILSFTGTSELLSNNEQIIQVYCVQTQAIQQYALDLSQCLPPHIDNLVLEKSLSNVEGLASKSSGPQEFVESVLSPRLSRELSGLSDQSGVHKVNEELNNLIKFKHPTHLITPSDLLMAKSSSEMNVQDSLSQNVELEVTVVDNNNKNELSQENKEKTFFSQASDLGIDMAREYRALSPESYVVVEESSGTHVETSIQEEVTQGKEMNAQDLATSSSLPISGFDSGDSFNEPGVSSNVPLMEVTNSQILAMQETLNQLVAMQKDMQKQILTTGGTSITKEGKRLEAAITKSMEKATKSNADALWAHFQEESVKQEKLAQERTHQLANLITNCINKDLPAILEKSIKKELSSVGQAIARTITPAIEKTVSIAIIDAFQKGVGDKAVNLLDKSVNSKLEFTVARQIQAQFQTTGKQALQETLKSTLEASVVPAFEMSCRAMFEQVDSTFRKGMSEHTASTHQYLESTNSSLALTLREALNSATSMTQTLTVELAEGQRKLLALANPNSGNSIIRELSNGPLSGLHDQNEVPVDPTKELSRLVTEHKYEEAFTSALQRSDVHIVSWLCSQVNLQGILSSSPLALSQGVLLSLLQQLACDVSKETSRKLMWMRDVISAVNPADPMIAVHVRPIFEQVYQILNHHRNLPTTTGSELSSIRLLMHVINSMLMTCK